MCSIWSAITSSTESTSTPSRQPLPTRLPRTAAAAGLSGRESTPRVPTPGLSSHNFLQIEEPTTVADKRHYPVAWCASRYLKCTAYYFYDSSLGTAHKYVWSCSSGVVKYPSYAEFKANLHFTGTGERTYYKCLIPDAVHGTRVMSVQGVEEMICKYDDLLKALLFLVYEDPDIRKHVFEELGIAPRQFSNATQYYDWLGLSENADDMLYNALEVLIAYHHLRRNDRLPQYVLFAITDTDTDWILLSAKVPRVIEC